MITIVVKPCYLIRRNYRDFVIKQLYIILFLLINLLPCTAQNDSEEQGALGRFFEKLYRKNYLDNKTLLELNTGIGKAEFKPNQFSKDLSRLYAAEIYYGFYREDYALESANVFGFTSEFASASSISAHLKPEFIKLNGISTDSWRFSLGLKDGYGYYHSPLGKFSLYHSGAINLNYIDFEAYPLVEENEKYKELALKYDDKAKFGQMWGTGIMINIIPAIKLNVGYEQNFVYPEIRSSWHKWGASFAIEAVAQNTPDIFEDKLLETTGDMFPLVMFFYKNGISYFFYQMRSRESFFPFESESPMDFQSLKLGLTFIL